MTLPGEKVSVDKIEEHLNYIWQQKADREDDVVVKTSTINFCIVCNMDVLEQTLSLVHNIVPHHPGRVFIAAFDDSESSHAITANLDTRCYQRKENKICSEMIVLRFGKNAEQHFTGLILPLILPNLPVYLWWMLPFDKLDAFASLLNSTDRLIINSPFLHRVEIKPFVRTMLSLENVKISDYIWGTLTSWREAMAHYLAVERLRDIQGVVFRGGGATPALKFWLLLGWLGSRLSWQPQKQGALPFRFLQNNHEIKVDYQVGKQSEHALSEIEFTLGRDIKLFRAKKNSIQIYTNNKIQGSVPLKSDPSQILCNELDILFQDRIYLETLEKLTELFRLTRHGKKADEKEFTY